MSPIRRISRSALEVADDIRFHKRFVERGVVLVAHLPAGAGERRRSDEGEVRFGEALYSPVFASIELRSITSFTGSKLVIASTP